MVMRRIINLLLAAILLVVPVNASNYMYFGQNTTTQEAAAAAFDPTDVSGCEVWIEIADSATVLESIGPDVQADSGDDIYRVKDQSGNDNHLDQDTATDQPMYNGTDNIMVCSSDYMELTTTINLRAMIVVVKNASGSDTFSNFTPLAGRDTGTSGQGSVFLDKSSYTISVDGSNSNSGDMTIDGNALKPGNSSGGNISYTGFTPFPVTATEHIVFFRLTNANTVKTFAFVKAGNSRLKASGQFGSAALFSEDVTTANRQKLEGYFAHERGIAGQLPAGHPYKSSPP